MGDSTCQIVAVLLRSEWLLWLLLIRDSSIQARSCGAAPVRLRSRPHVKTRQGNVLFGKGAFIIEGLSGKSTRPGT
jgi:hypothetical protein